MGNENRNRNLMHFTVFGLVTLCLALTAVLYHETCAGRWAPTPERLDTSVMVNERMGEIPVCVKSCIFNRVKSLGCAHTDIACICRGFDALEPAGTQVAVQDVTKNVLEEIKVDSDIPEEIVAGYNEVRHSKRDLPLGSNTEVYEEESFSECVELCGNGASLFYLPAQIVEMCAAIGERAELPEFMLKTLALYPRQAGASSAVNSLRSIIASGSTTSTRTTSTTTTPTPTPTPTSTKTTSTSTTTTTAARDTTTTVAAVTTTTTYTVLSQGQTPYTSTVTGAGGVTVKVGITAGAPTPTPTPIASDPTPPFTSTGDSGGLSTGAKIGLGVGIGLVVILLAILAIILCLRRRRNKKQGDESVNAIPELAGGGKVGDAKPGELEGSGDRKDPTKHVYTRPAEFTGQGGQPGHTGAVELNSMNVQGGYPGGVHTGATELNAAGGQQGGGFSGPTELNANTAPIGQPYGQHPNPGQGWTNATELAGAMPAPLRLPAHELDSRNQNLTPQHELPNNPPTGPPPAFLRKPVSPGPPAGPVSHFPAPWERTDAEASFSAQYPTYNGSSQNLGTGAGHADNEVQRMEEEMRRVRQERENRLSGVGDLDRREEELRREIEARRRGAGGQAAGRGSGS